MQFGTESANTRQTTGFVVSRAAIVFIGADAFTAPSMRLEIHSSVI